MKHERDGKYAGKYQCTCGFSGNYQQVGSHIGYYNRLPKTMESDAAKAIKFCQKMKFVKLVVRFNKKKGWTVDQQYCCPKHAPKEIINPR